ncbi:hypothetical protein GCM10027199_39510 [Amycolatopsis magusensis]
MCDSPAHARIPGESHVQEAELHTREADPHTRAHPTVTNVAFEAKTVPKATFVTSPSPRVPTAGRAQKSDHQTTQPLPIPVHSQKHGGGGVVKASFPP